MIKIIISIIALGFFGASLAVAQWPVPKSPVIPQADGYSLIPNAALRPEHDHIYKVVFQAKSFPAESNDLLPALNNAGAELNAFGIEGVPKQNWKFVIVFYGTAVDGLLDEPHYKAKFGVSNPNLKVISELKHEGVELYVCGQTLVYDKIDPGTISPDITIAADALIVLIKFQNMGYALLTF